MADPLLSLENELRAIASSLRKQGSIHRPHRLDEIAKALHDYQLAEEERDLRDQQRTLEWKNRELQMELDYRRRQELIMARVADAIHKLQQQLITANADRDAAKADADKFRADADRLSQLTTDGRVLDDADVAALNAVESGSADTTGGTTGEPTGSNPAPEGTGEPTGSG